MGDLTLSYLINRVLNIFLIKGKEVVDERITIFDFGYRGLGKFVP